MAHDVFISHSSQDKAAAEAACAALEAQGIGCWMAARDILPSADWGASIVRAIGEAKVFLLIFSSSANVSPHVVREVERAVNRSLPIIPVRIEETAPGASLEYFLNTPHWLDAYRPPFDQHLDYVVRVVRLLLAGDASVAPGRPTATPPPSQPPPLPPAPRRSWVLVVSGIAACAAVGLVVGAALWWPRTAPAPVAPTADLRCLAGAPSIPNPANCAAMLDQNPVWQGCAASYADGDNPARLAQASRMIATGRTGSDLYSASPQFRDYGAISHYWEMFGECVNGGYVKFADISGGVAFPDQYWMRTAALRRELRANWNGPGQPLPDFMSNFQALCQRYKAARESVRAGGGQALDCTR